MSPTIVLRCHGCNARIKAPVQLVGQRRRCPGCGAEFVVRNPVPPDLGPIFVNGERPRVPQPANPA